MAENRVQIIIESIFAGQGIDEGSRRFRALVDEVERGQARLAQREARYEGALRTGGDVDQTRRGFRESLAEEERRTRTLTDATETLIARKREIARLQEEYLAAGKPSEAAKLQPELVGLAQLEKEAGRRPYRFEEATHRMGERASDAERRSGVETDETPWWNRRVPGTGLTRGAMRDALVSMVAVSAIRGMPVAEQEAHLRYQVAAPGTRPGDGGVDAFGREVAEAGRAMHFSRLETLRAAEAYERFSGQVGHKLVPELEQLTQAARYHRMELGEAAQYFGRFRRLTAADDPNAMRQIATTVRAAMEGAGPSRRDELREAILSLAERSAHGVPEGLTPEAGTFQSALLTMLHRTGQPGFQGEAGASVAQRAFQLPFNAQDPQDVVRWAALTGQMGRLEGPPGAAMWKMGLQMERIRGLQPTQDDLRHVFTAMQRTRELGGPDADAQRFLTWRLLMPQVSQREFMGLEKVGGFQSFDRFSAEMDRILKDARTKQLGPDAAQQDSQHVANQESRRRINDALGQVGSLAVDVRNRIFGIVSGAVGGGPVGDLAALGVEGLMGYGAFSTGARAVRGLFGGPSATRGGGLLWRALGGAVRGGGSRLFGGGTAVAERAGLAGVAGAAGRGLGAGARGFGPALALTAVELGADYANQFTEPSGQTHAALEMTGAYAGIGGYMAAGAAIGSVIPGVGTAIGAGAGAAYGAWRNTEKLAHGAIMLGSTGDRIRAQEAKLGRMGQSKDAAALNMLREAYGGDGDFSDIQASYWKNREKRSEGVAFEYARGELSQKYGHDLSDEQLERGRGMFGGGAPPASAGGGRNRMQVDVNVNMSGDKSLTDVGREVGDRVAEVVKQNLPEPEDIYDPRGYGWSAGGALG